MKITGLLMFTLAAAAFAADDIAMVRVIGREVPGEYKHPCTITQLDNGDLYIAYYGGSGEYEDDSKVWGIRKATGSDTWSPPECIADTPFLGEGNAVVWQAPDGLVWLFYVQRYGNTWSDSRVQAKISKDGARTWSDSFMITFQQGMMVQGLPTLLTDGTYLLPAYY
ncbi:MAG: exo-alpha-sialidase, partial [Candidatus Hydrogenedentales bacterium]